VRLRVLVDGNDCNWFGEGILAGGLQPYGKGPLAPDAKVSFDSANLNGNEAVSGDYELPGYGFCD
jgi:hypothetical protein